MKHRAHGRLGRGLGRKTIADKVGSALRKMPEHLAREMRRGFAADRDDASRRLGAGFDDPADRAAFAEITLPLQCVQWVIGSLGGLPGLSTLRRQVDEADETYMPGGPPMSPVHDSLFTAWSSLDLHHGPHRETVASIVLAVAGRLGLEEGVVAGLQRLVQTHLTLVRVQSNQPAKQGASARYRVREVVTGTEFSLQFVEDYDIRDADLILVRPFPLSAEAARARGVTHVVGLTPYVLEGFTEPQWRDYFERAAGELRCRLDPDAYVRIMRGYGAPTRWLDFVVDGYVGQRAKNVVRVAGIPDRPETLPHHLDHRREDARTIPRGSPPGERATILARRILPALMRALEATPAGARVVLARRFEALVRHGGEVEHWQPLVMTVALHEPDALCTGSIADRVSSAGELDPEEAEYVEALRGGVTSIFEVLEVQPGRSMTVRDLLGDGEYEVHERSGTENLPARVLLLARLSHYRDQWLCDAVCPHPLPPSRRDAVLRRVARHKRTPAGRLAGRALFDAMVDWQQEHTALAQERAAAPRPRMTTTTGEPVAWTTIRLSFGALHRPQVLEAVSRLRRCERDREDETAFVVLTATEMVEGRIEVGSQALSIESNAKARAERIAKRITSKLPGMLERVETTTTPIEEMMRNATPRVSEVPTESMKMAIASVLEQHYATFLDHPVPALQGRTPRQAAADPKLRESLDALLRDHEFGVTQQHGPGVVDFAAIRRELGL